MLSRMKNAHLQSPRSERRTYRRGLHELGPRAHYDDDFIHIPGDRAITNATPAAAHILHPKRCHRGPGW
jgi:hypothetical protein